MQFMKPQNRNFGGNLQILPDYILQVPAKISVLWFHKLHRGFPVLHDWIYK